jgi:hypothetical protein
VIAYGHIPDLPDTRDWRWDETAMGVRRTFTGSSGSIDYSELLDEVQDQRSNSCVGHAIASACFLTAAIRAEPIPRPSALLPYTMARLADGQRPLLDFGCRPRMALMALRDFGLIPLEAWPETDENIGTVPPDDLWARAEGAQVPSFYRIEDGGDVRGGLVEALRRGLIPLFGMSVDASYEQIGRSIYSGPSGPELGRHAQIVVGYSAVMDAFKVLSSWGTVWGNGGFAWIAAEFMSRSTFDRLVIDVVPRDV